MSDSKNRIIPIETSVDADVRSCAELEPFALRVVGDSMAPEFLDGHVIVLDPGLAPVHRAYAVMEISGDVVFRQYWVEGGRVFLRALAEGYPMVELAGAYRVVGVVVQRAGKRRADRKRYD